MKRKLISMLLMVSMTAALFVGCGNSEGSEKPDAGTTKDEGNTADEEDVEDEEMAEIVIGWMAFSTLDESKTEGVEDAINAITEKEINTHVDIQWYDPNSYATQIPMMIQANEKLDLLMYTPVPGAGFTSFYNQNQLLEIDGLLEEYGKDIVSMLGNLLDATSGKDGLYGIPAYRDMGSSATITMRKDILDQLGLTEKARNMTTWTEYEEILTEVTKNTELTGICNADAAGTVVSTQPFFMGADKFADAYSYDNLGDTYLMMSTDTETDTVGCYYFTEQYQQMVQRANDWYKKGLVYKDSATNKEMGGAMMKNNVVFSSVQMCELGAENTKAVETGYEVVCVNITENLLSTGSCTKFGFAVPVTATEPEAAVKFLNLLYTNEDVVSTMAWGVEGRDWVRTDDGFATYPEGVTAETVQYHTADFLSGNQFIVVPWEGSEENIREQQKASLENTPVSKYLGFAFDATGLETELTACFNVGEQYRSGLASGSVDYESTYKAFTEALTGAGIEKIIAAYQEQLNAWLAAK